MSEETGPEFLRRVRDEADQRTALASAAYEALKGAGRLRAHRLLTYRCARRCLLVDVLNFPQGVVFHTPGYKLSPSVNTDTSNASGRAKNTIDGARRWKAHTYFAQECVNVTANCDHVQNLVLEKDEIQADLDAGHAEVVLPRH